MKLRWDLWLYGIMAAFITGGATAITGVQSATMLAPDTFNLTTGFRRTVVLFCIVFVESGIIGAAAYLKTHPTPSWEGDERRAGRTTVTEKSESVTMSTGPTPPGVKPSTKDETNG